MRLSRTLYKDSRSLQHATGPLAYPSFISYNYPSYNSTEGHPGLSNIPYHIQKDSCTITSCKIQALKFPPSITPRPSATALQQAMGITGAQEQQKSHSWNPCVQGDVQLLLLLLIICFIFRMT